MNDNGGNERSLPDGWEWFTLADCVDILDGRRKPINSGEREERIAGKDQSELISYYGSTGHVGWIDDFIFDEEILLLGEDAAPFLELTKDKAYVVRGKSWVNNHAHVLRAKSGITTNLFLKHYLNIFDYHEYVTGTTRLKLNQGRMRVMPVPLPPLPEQERIVNRIEELFSDLDAGVAALERVQKGLQRYKVSLLKTACDGKLLENKEVESGKLPEGWRWVEVGELCDCIVPNRDKPKSFSGDVPWITLPDFGESIEIRESKSGLGLTEDEIKKYRARVIPAGSVVMSCIGRFGITAVATRNIVVNQQLHAFLIPENVLDARYLAYALRTQIPYMEKLATATTIAYLNKGNCNSVPIPLPPLEEQWRIVAEVERRLSVVGEVESAVEVGLVRAGRLRQSLLRSAFEGRL